MQGGPLPLFPELKPEISRSRVSNARLPTNTTTYKHPIHRWFNFIAGFSPEFVELCISENGDSSAMLLDPFAGCATAPLTACQLGLRAIGYEPHPVLARIARAKFPGNGAIETVRVIETLLLNGIANPKPIDSLPPDPAKFLTSLFPLESLASLLGARDALIGGLGQNDLAFLILSRVVDRCSHSQTDGIYKAPTSRKKPQNPAAAVREVIAMVKSDLQNFRGAALDSLAVVREASSAEMRDVDDESIDIVVTSPPYLNNFDFAEMTRMLLYFWGIAESWADITHKVRSKLIVNTTTALKGHKAKQQQYREGTPSVVLEHLDELVLALAEQRKVRAGKKEYDFLVYPYFCELTKVVRECYRCMKPGAPIHFMISDAALYGVHIDAPQILERLLSAIGFRLCECILVRKRGHRWILDKRDGSKQGLGEYHVRAKK